MTIDEKIKQSQLQHPYYRAAVNLLYTARKLESHVKEIFKKEEVTHQQYNVLCILRNSGSHPLSTMQIRDRMLNKMSDTSRMVNRLILKKLVTKETSADDQRAVDILLTDKGQELLKHLDDMDNRVSSFLKNITESDANALSVLLDKVHEEKDA
jgi:DNA-binding MarR family transcriptional regulator